jgi:hypothetical protein
VEIPNEQEGSLCSVNLTKYSGNQIKEESDGWDMWNIRGTGDVHTGFC